MGTLKIAPGAALKNLEALIASVPGHVAKVGFLDSAQYSTGVSIAYVAAIHEFGAPSAGIVPRSFMRPTMDAQKNSWKNLFAQGAKAIAKGNRTAKDVYDGVGLQASGDVRKAISTLTSPPLSKVTLLARKFKQEHGPDSITGFGQIVGFMHDLKKNPDIDLSGVSTKPLNDTGALLAHVTNTTEEA